MKFFKDVTELAKAVVCFLCIKKKLFILFTVYLSICTELMSYDYHKLI